ncbi:hypothetical protein D9M73_210420 [compost metagenome]
MEIPAAHVQPVEQFAQVEQPSGDHMAHAALRLQRAVHLHQPRFQERPPLALGEVVPDHHVEHAELVFQGDEGHPAGGLRALAADHQAGDAHRAAVFQRRQFPGAAATARLQRAAQQLHGMRTEGGAEDGVVGQQVLAAGR